MVYWFETKKTHTLCTNPRNLYMWRRWPSTVLLYICFCIALTYGQVPCEQGRMGQRGDTGAVGPTGADGRDGVDGVSIVGPPGANGTSIVGPKGEHFQLYVCDL